MAVIYTYSLSVAFSSNLNSSQLHNEIVASSITTTLNHVEVNGDDVDIEFISALSTSDQTALGVLVTTHSPLTNTPGDTFDCIVDASGNGDYLKPSAAFADGHVSVFMRNGVYVETTDVIIPNYGSLVGESGPNTIIYFPGIAKSVIVDGSGGRQETTGVISISVNTNNVVGVGTTFTNLTANDYILLGTDYFKIASITDDTNLVLSDIYRGASHNSIKYIAQPMFTGVRLNNFIISGSTTTGLYIRGNRHFNADSIALNKNTPNILIENTGDSSFKHILSETCLGAGMTLNNCVSIALNVVDVYNNTSHGICIGGNSTSINLISCETSNNGGDGINMSQVCSDINLTDCVIKYNNGNGIVSNSTTQSVMIDSTSIRGNTSTGLSIDGLYHTITGNIIDKNGSDGLYLTASYCTITGNIINGNTISIKSTGDGCIISSNQCINSSVDGIYVSGNNCILTSNMSTGNAQYGINIDTGVIDTVVSLNNCINNIGTNIIDNGTTTTLINNKS